MCLLCVPKTPFFALSSQLTSVVPHRVDEVLTSLYLVPGRQITILLRLVTLSC